MTTPACLQAARCVPGSSGCVSALLFSYLSYVQLPTDKCLTIPRSRHEAANILESSRSAAGVCVRCVVGPTSSKTNHAHGQELPNHIAYHALLPAGLGRRLANEIPTLVERAMLAS